MKKTFKILAVVSIVTGIAIVIKNILDENIDNCTCCGEDDIEDDDMLFDDFDDDLDD